MKLTYSSFKDEDKFILTDFTCKPSQELFEQKGLYKILWSREGSVDLTVDDYQLNLKKNEVIFCTPLNVMKVPMDNKGLVAFVFNKQFFCIQTHDDQVSCNGFLFFGSAQPQLISLSENESEHFELMYQLFVNDLSVKDNLQGELLRSMLKRLLIISTRMLKNDLPEPALPNGQMDTIREFNLLVEQHFKEMQKESSLKQRDCCYILTNQVMKSPTN